MKHSDLIQAIVDSTSNVVSSTHEARIEKTSSRHVTVHVPLDAIIVKHYAQIRNVPWPDGPDWGTNWVDASYGLEPMGWCRCDFVGLSTNHHTKTVTVVFKNWSNVKPREGRLTVLFKPHSIAAQDVKITTTEFSDTFEEDLMPIAQSSAS